MKGKITKENLKNLILKLKKSNNKELNEFIDEDGMIANSSIPILNKGLHPKRTMDQTVVAVTQPNNSILRGHRTYYAESVVDENDFSGAFGYKETKNMDGEKTVKKLKDMGLDSEKAKERAEEFGKDPTGKRKKKAVKRIKKKKGFIDRLTLLEKQEQLMIKMLEDIIVDKNEDESSIIKKEKKLFSRLFKNEVDKLIQMAKKEGLSIKELIKFILRKDNE